MKKITIILISSIFANLTFLNAAENSRIEKRRGLFYNLLNNNNDQNPNSPQQNQRTVVKNDSNNTNEEIQNNTGITRYKHNNRRKPIRGIFRQLFDKRDEQENKVAEKKETTKREKNTPAQITNQTITQNNSPTQITQTPKITKNLNQSEQNYLTYKVKFRDSIWKISQKYGTSVKDIKDANNLSTGLIKIGQELKIPVSKELTKSQAKKLIKKNTIAKSTADSDINADANKINPTPTKATNLTKKLQTKSPANVANTELMASDDEYLEEKIIDIKAKKGEVGLLPQSREIEQNSLPTTTEEDEFVQENLDGLTQTKEEVTTEIETDQDTEQITQNLEERENIIQNAIETSQQNAEELSENIERVEDNLSNNLDEVELTTNEPTEENLNLNDNANEIAETENSIITTGTKETENGKVVISEGTKIEAKSLTIKNNAETTLNETTIVDGNNVNLASQAKQNIHDIKTKTGEEIDPATNNLTSDMSNISANAEKLEQAVEETTSQVKQETNAISESIQSSTNEEVKKLEKASKTSPPPSYPEINSMEIENLPIPPLPEEN